MNLARISKAIAAGAGAAATALGAQQAGTPPPIWAQLILAILAGAVTGLVTYKAPANKNPSP